MNLRQQNGAPFRTKWQDAMIACERIRPGGMCLLYMRRKSTLAGNELANNCAAC
jgi:hypothetical protein